MGARRCAGPSYAPLTPDPSYNFTVDVVTENISHPNFQGPRGVVGHPSRLGPAGQTRDIPHGAGQPSYLGNGHDRSYPSKELLPNGRRHEGF
jgi:hypothetical protein